MHPAWSQAPVGARARPSRRRRGELLVLALVAVVTAATVPTATAAAAAPDEPAAEVDELRDQLQRTDEATRDAQDELDRTRAEIATVTAQLRESAALVEAYETQLAELQAQLREAEAEAAAAAARSEEARRELALVDEQLAATERRLAESQSTFDDRAVSAFMYGEATMADAVAGSQSLDDLVTTTFYMRTVLVADTVAVDDVDQLRALQVQQRTQADLLRETVELEQIAADQARLELADLTDAQERLTTLAEEERSRRADLLAELEFNEAATEAQLAELEAESTALEQRLREVQWQAGAPGDGTWVWPTTGRQTSPFGYRTHPIYGGRRLHAGVDVSAPTGTPIVAANDGLVIDARCSSGGYGCRIVIDHGGGVASLYAHQSSFAVDVGTVVAAGDVIGSVGSTGASTGPHLHFEIRVDGVPTDPMTRY